MMSRRVFGMGFWGVGGRLGCLFGGRRRMGRVGVGVGVGRLLVGGIRCGVM